jgi:hypothetical protein
MSATLCTIQQVTTKDRGGCRTGVTAGDLVGGIELGGSTDVCVRHDGRVSWLPKLETIPGRMKRFGGGGIRVVVV